MPVPTQSRVGAMAARFSVPRKATRLFYSLSGPRIPRVEGKATPHAAGAINLALKSLPEDTDYRLVFTAVSNDGSVFCNGATGFDVMADTTTALELRTDCAPRTALLQ